MTTRLLSLRRFLRGLFSVFLASWIVGLHASTDASGANGDFSYILIASDTATNFVDRWFVFDKDYYEGPWTQTNIDYVKSEMVRCIAACKVRIDDNHLLAFGDQPTLLRLPPGEHVMQITFDWTTFTDEILDYWCKTTSQPKEKIEFITRPSWDLFFGRENNLEYPLICHSKDGDPSQPRHLWLVPNAVYVLEATSEISVAPTDYKQGNLQVESIVNTRVRCDPIFLFFKMPFDNAMEKYIPKGLKRFETK